MLSDGNDFDLIIVDEFAFGRTGLEIVQKIRESQAYDRTPLVFLAGSSHMEPASAALEFGANDYIRRPFSPFSFIKQIRRLLTRGLSVPSPHARLQRILIVDEDIKELFTAATALTTHGGFRVTLAKGSADARARLAEIKPDIVLLSPDRVNREAAGEFLSVLPTDVMVAVILSEDQRVQQAELQSRHKFDGELRKPINALTLATQMVDVLGLTEGHECSTDSADLLNRELMRIVAMSPPKTPGPDDVHWIA
jgi:DNA-binding response OmpR family regulator